MPPRGTPWRLFRPKWICYALVMYVCHCNRIPEREILAAIAQVSVRANLHATTPNDVLAALNRQGKCLGCFPLIATLTEKFARGRTLRTSEPSRPNVPVTPIHTAAATATTFDDHVDAPKPRRRGGAFARRQGA